MTVPWTRVEPLDPQHDLDSFSSGREAVDRWLHETAGRAPRVATHVCLDDHGRVIAFFALRGIQLGTDAFPSAMGYPSRS